MRFEELSHMMQKPDPKPDTYEAGMAQNQLLKIGSHAIRLHNMIDDGQEMESWVAKKIDLASNYVKSVHGYTAGSKAGTYDDDGMSEGTDTTATDKEIKMAKGIAFDKRNKDNMSKATSTIEKVRKGLSQQPDVADALRTANEDEGDKYFDFENSDEYADNVEKYGDVDKTPLTPQERQQFKKWLIDTANDYSSMALDGVEEIGDDPSAIEDQYHKFIPKIKEYLKKAHATQNIDDFASDVLGVEEKFGDEDMLMNDEGHRQASDFSQHATHYTGGLEDVSGSDFTVKTIRAVLDMIDDDPHIASAMLVFQQDFEGTPLQKKVSRVQASESAVNEDAGEGHMSKSQLYATAKMAIELIDMIKKGDDLEGWVQTKLNLAADYLQAVYHYDDYQKLNPYREDLDGQLMQKHAGVIQKNLDEILARETKTADVDTKPGMMRILKKRVNEVEKEIAKENRKNTDEGGMPSSVIKSKQKYANMTDKELADRFKGADEKTLRQMAWRHGYGNMSSHYLDRVKNVMTSKRTGTTESELEEGLKEDLTSNVAGYLDTIDEYVEMLFKSAKDEKTTKIAYRIQNAVDDIRMRELKLKPSNIRTKYNSPVNDAEELEEGLKDWAKKTAAAGIIVAGLAGFNSINNAIDNSVPAIQAMNSALEMVIDQNDDKLAQLIKKDLSDAKLRLDIGKDLSYVKGLQDKYIKFMPTEGLAYESKLAVQLNQQLK